MLIDRENIEISIRHRAELLGISRSSIYYQPGFYPTPTLTQVHIYDTLPNYSLPTRDQLWEDWMT